MLKEDSSDASVEPPADAAEEQPSRIRASELRYRRLFETARDGIILLDAETGLITDVNPFLLELLGYSHVELMGKALWEIGPFKDIEASQTAMRHLQDKDYIRYDDLPLETKGKVRVQVEFVSNVYLVDGVRVIQCNVRDITARKAAESGALKLNDDLRTLVARLEQRDGEMNRLNQMSDLLHACTTQDEAFKVVALMAGDLFAGSSGLLAILHPRDRRLETVARWGIDAEVASTFPLDDCWAMRRGQPHEVSSSPSGLVCRHLMERPVSGSLCVPLTVQGETLGLLCLLGAADNGHYAPGRVALAITLGETVKLSIANLRLREKLREQATQDSLTGLYNRRYLDEILTRELHRALRRKSPLSVAMLDLDHFKLLNDTFGHETGDTVLRELGKLLRDNVRKSDLCCRYGGEEFVVVFPDSSSFDTRQRVDQIRILLKGLTLNHGTQPLGPITVSAGIAQAISTGSTPSGLLRAADEALYLAKEGGRDRVIEHSPRE